MKSPNLRYSVCILFLIASFVFCSVAQEQFAFDETAEKEFTNVLTLYEEGKYPEAAAQFEQIASLRPFHQKTTAAYVMAAKSYIQLRLYFEADALLEAVKKEFPTSRYRDEVLFLRGLTQTMLGKYQSAVFELCQAAAISRESDLIRRADSLIDVVAQQYLSISVLQDILQSNLPEREYDLLQLILGEKYRRQGNLVDARVAGESVLQRNPPSPYAAHAKFLLEKIAQGIKVKVGVLLPLMQGGRQSYSKTVAEDVLAGIHYAFDEYQSWLPPTLHISLVVQDTKRDSAVAKRLVKEMRTDDELVAIIGPLYSDIAAVCIPLVEESRLPLLLPTATAHGLAEQSPYVFQCNPDVTIHGRALARYAVRSLNCRSFAAIVPDDSDAQLLIESFQKEIERLGGRMIAREHYADSSLNLQEQFIAVRRAIARSEPTISFAGKISREEINQIVRAGANPHLVDSLVAKKGFISVTRLFGTNGKHIADSLRLGARIRSVDWDNLEVPMTGLDCLVLPITSSERLGEVASQAIYYNIQTQIVGSPEWNDMSQLESQRRYTEGAIFSSESFVEGDSAMKVFEKEFARKMQRTVSKYVLYGYDCMRLLLSRLAGGAVTRENLQRALSATKNFRGKAMTISFGTARVNSSVQILKYGKNGIENIGTVNVNHHDE
jgi:ABC-type branched-subunit amino acid transport system substrate-binding protein